MNSLQPGTDHVVDVIFSLEGQTLPRDHAQALQQALCDCFPWLQTDAGAAVLPLKLVAGEGDRGLLSRRTPLVLRVNISRMPDLLTASGREILVEGYPLRLNNPHPRALRPHATLYAYKVACSDGDEVAFMQTVNQELAQLGVGAERVCGKRGHMQVSGRMLDTYSLMLHALSPDQSLRIQHLGLGPHRLLGCGVFVPHKSAAAV